MFLAAKLRHSSDITKFLFKFFAKSYRYRFRFRYRFSLSFFVTKEQPAVGQEAVEHEEFVAHAVSGVTADGGADDETKYWSCYAYNGCIAALPVAMEQGEGEQS